MAREAGYYSRRMQELREARGNRCARCGMSATRAKMFYPNGLEFAHLVTTTVNGTGRGLPQRYYDIKNNPDAYELLCRTCHREQEGRGGPMLPQEVPF